MADDEEAILKAKLEEAADYEERARIRRQLRALKKKKDTGEQSSFTRKGSAAYRRFSGVAVDQKATSSSSKSSTVPVKVFGKLGPHPEISRTPSPSSSDSSYKASSVSSLKAVSPTHTPSDATSRKLSQPQSTESEEDKEETAAVNGASPPPPPQDTEEVKPDVGEGQSKLSQAVGVKEKDEEVCSDQGEKGKEDEQSKENVVEADVKEVEVLKVEASLPEEKMEEEGMRMEDSRPEEAVREKWVKKFQPEEKVEEESVKESQTEEKMKEEKEQDVLPDERVKESQLEEEVEEKKDKVAQPEEKMEEERAKDEKPKEKVEEEKVKDVQPEEKVSTAVGKEETDFHFRRRAKTEVRPKPSPAPAKAAEFQGFKLRKAAKDTKETKARPADKAAEFQAFQLRKTGSPAQKTAAVVETASQPTVKPTRLQESQGKEGPSSVWKAREAKETEVQPTAKAPGFRGFQGRTVDSSAQKTREPPATKVAEFQGFQLRKTETSTTRSRAQTWGVTARPAVKKTPISLPKVSDAKELTVAELDSCLDQFVNRVFKFPTNGKPLNTFCKDPRVLCNWINQAVPGTVDLRALTVAKDRRAEEFAREENMTLAAESARAIGCRILDDTEKRLLNGDSSVCRQLVMDLVKARAVNLPGMRDAPEGTFQDPSLLFAVFGIGPAATQEATDGSLTASKPMTSARAAALPESDKRSSTAHEDSRHVSTPLKHATTVKQPVTTTKEPVITSNKPVSTSKESVPTSKEPTGSSTPSSSASADKESGDSSKVADISGRTDLSYEERAALRRAAREKRKQERAALAAKS